MTRYNSFIFKNYVFDKDQRSLRLTYSFDNDLEFNETFKFDFDFAQYNPGALDKACQLLFFLAGVSYYKAYLVNKIKIEFGQINKLLSEFLDKTYQKGLGEFFYVNKLDPNTPICFPVNSDSYDTQATGSGEGLLVGIGGGKDSLVSVELLRGKVDKLATWSVGHKPQLQPLVTRIGLPHFWVERDWDKSLLEHNLRGSLNGHIPISAIFAATGVIVAILSGYKDVVVSNEHSANEPTLNYDGTAINHQYSKSQEFEEDMQKILAQVFGDRVRYYSSLRPYSELRVAEIFATVGFDKYQDVFSSCNRAFTHDSHHIFWDGTCPKCAFVFLALTPFLERQKLEHLFGGKNLLLDPSLEATYKNLLGIEGDKPLECVGEIKESRSAMELAKKIYPELGKYQYELPADYNYREVFRHSMPPEIYSILQNALS